jgi:serine/threonine protein kinase/tetratricopeptide (TPR) repeat protein
MGEVYAAYDPELDRKVAVKLLHVSGGVGPELVEQKARLLREAQAIARLSHPNVVVVHDVGSFEDQVFVAMEFVDGHTVAYWLQAGQRHWREILDVFVAAGRGLAAAHAAQLVHRDFKGDNVMITSSAQVRVMDFGLARHSSDRSAAGPPVPLLPARDTAHDLGSTIGLPAQQAVAIGEPLTVRAEVPQDSKIRAAPLDANLTQTGLLVGTPAYMAPEQFRGQVADARSDQFSFCVALYEALYGERPFGGKTMAELADNVLRGLMRSVPATKRVPGWLRRALLRGLANDPNARWPSMEALLAALVRNPRARGWWYLTAGVAVVSSVIATLALSPVSRPRPTCQVGADRFAGVWEGPGAHAARRASIAASIRASGKPHAGETFDSLARLLDGYVGRWSGMYRDACEATNVRGEQSNEVLDLRMSCLRDRWNELRALSDVLVEGHAVVVTNAVAAATALTPIERCADVTSANASVAPPTDPGTRGRVDALRDRLVAIKALEDAGRYTRALDATREVVAEAREVGYRPLIAEALNRLVLLQVDTRHPREADVSAEEALWIAEASHHDELVVELAAIEIYVVGYVEHDMTRAWRWINQAQVFLDRIGGHDLLRAWVLNNIGIVLDANGDQEGAATQLYQALRIKERVLGKDHADVAYTLSNLADTLRTLGRAPEALDLINRGLDIFGRTFGASHPRLVPQLVNRAEILNQLSRYAEARRDAERAIAIQESEPGPHTDLIYALGPLGESFLGLGQPVSAIEPLRRAVKLAEEEALADELPRLRFALARALWDGGRDKRGARALAIVVAAGQSKGTRGGRGDESFRSQATTWLATHR